MLATPYDPRLPSIQSIMAKHWRSMAAGDSHLQTVFKEPPLIAFKRQTNLRGHLIRAKVARKNTPYPKRYLKGMKKCGSSCPACPYLKEGDNFKINGVEWKIKRQFDCNSYNIVYTIFSMKDNCRNIYIGETKRMLKFRLADHRGYVSSKDTDKATGAHFNMPGHALADLRVAVIEQTRGKSSAYRKEREHYYIRKFDTFYHGMNRQK